MALQITRAIGANSNSTFHTDSRLPVAATDWHDQDITITIEITVQSIEEYLQVLAVLDRAVERVEFGFEWTAGPSTDSYPAIAEHAVMSDYFIIAAGDIV